MKNFLFRCYLRWMKFLCVFTGMVDSKVVILNGAGRSGSNGYVFYKWMLLNHPEMKTVLVEPWPSSHLSWATWQEIASARWIITTHQPFKVKKHQINIQLWHGVPLKRMGTMANNTKRRDNQRNEKLWHTTADCVASSSDWYETLMSSCMGIESRKYRKIGFPRLDALKHPIISRDELLKDLFKAENVAPKAKIGIYMPTFRYEMESADIMEQIKAGNFFAFADFDGAALNQALKEQNTYLIVKLHPWEMRLFDNLASHYSNIAFLNNDYLNEHDYDLYELLGDTDFLMTDFSSIYFDYLLLDRPIIFIDNYLDQYEKTRGLLMGPYAEITPGIKAGSQAEVLAAINQPDSAHWQAERKRWRQLTQQVEGDYCQNLFDYMMRP